MPSLAIRPFVSEDLEATVALWARARWDAQPWLEERMGHGPEDDLRHFREHIVVEHDVWVACEADRPVGFLTMQGGLVGHLYVEPACQGRGVGSALLAHAHARAPGRLELFTHQRNARARAFYERRGFRAVAFGTSPPPESEPDVRYVWEPSEA